MQAVSRTTLYVPTKRIENTGQVTTSTVSSIAIRMRIFIRNLATAPWSPMMAAKRKIDFRNGTKVRRLPWNQHDR